MALKMGYEIRINLENAAFQDGGNEGAEVARILRDLANFCEENGRATKATLRDSNGNVVGYARGWV